MKKKTIIISIIIISILSIIGIFIYNKWRIANAKIIVEVQDNLEIDVYSEVRLSDLIKSINGKLIDDYEINTKTIGTKPIDFNYINEDNIKVSYSFNIKIVDKVPPLIFSSNSLNVTRGYKGDLEEADSIITDLINKKPNHSKALYLKAIIEKEKGNYEEAIKYAKKTNEFKISSVSV